MLWEIVFFCLSVLIYILFLVEKSYQPARNNLKFLAKLSISSSTSSTSSLSPLDQKSTTTTKDNNEENFLKQILISWSSVNTSFMFAGSILETYLFGARIIFNTLSVCLGYLLALVLFQSFFYKLDKSINSPYEYIEQRYPGKYGKILRNLCTMVSCIFSFSFLTLHLWGSAITLSILLPIHLSLSTFLVGLISLLMTFLTHNKKQFFFVHIIQFLIILLALLMAILIDLFENEHGKPAELIDIAREYGRLKIIETTFDLTTKYTIWNQVFSSPISWCAFHCLVPSNFKKIRSTSTNLKSKILLMSNIPLIIIINCLLVFAGIMSFVHFYGCDPILIKKFDDKNQIGPYWLMQSLSKKIPSLTGLAFASYILISLNQHSMGLSALKTTILSDLCRDFKQNKRISSEKVNFILNFLLSILSLSGAMLLTYARNSLLSLFYLFSNTFNPPLFGLMLLSIYNPMANCFGALISFCLSLFASVWLLVGRIYFLHDHSPEFEPNTFLCENSTLPIDNYSFSNVTTLTSTVHPAFSLYNISSLWYPLFSVLFIFLFGSLLSLIYSLIKSKIKAYIK
ncbi:unnamed protein product [Brachionus calyciflorus]|uniref:Uncharacterized protein n=1 Tax=Brachionus calyciflorus TaxID=104777 RepID=A0A813NV06_9BILA|nr:unnamed protein product [Brachionus calyciflorus]